MVKGRDQVVAGQHSHCDNNGFTGVSQCLAMVTNPCHRPQVDSATCSSCCSLFSSSPLSSPVPLFFSHLFFPPHPFSFPVLLFFSHLSFSFPVPLFTLQQTSLLSSFSASPFLSLCLPLFLRERSSSISLLQNSSCHC